MPKSLQLILHETLGSSFSLVPGDFLSYGSNIIDIPLGARTSIKINVIRKDMNIRRKRGLCKDYKPDESQNRCYIEKNLLKKFTNIELMLYFDQHRLKCANVTKLCMIPQIMNIFNDSFFKNVSQCVTEREYGCMADILQTVPYEMKNLCPNPCVKTRFQITKKTNTHDVPNKALISLRYESDEISFSEEYLIFDISDILVAIGGSLGLFLGFSFLQCGSVLFERIFRTMKKIFS